MNKIARSFLVIVAVLSLPIVAFADGGAFVVEEEWVDSPSTANQRAVIFFVDGIETLIVDTEYSGAAADFTWVLPTPTTVEISNISLANPGIIEKFNWWTTPRIENWMGDCGCLCCSSAEDTLDDRAYAGVTVFGRGTVGDYEIAVVGADNSGGLGGWLTDNGYAFPESASATFDYYIDREFSFVAIKYTDAGRTGAGKSGLSAAAAGDDDDDDGEGMARKPLMLSFAAEQPIFPMRISSISSEAEVEALVYLVSETDFYQSSNYTTVTFPEATTIAARVKGFADRYDLLFRKTLRQNGPRTLIVEYAGTFYTPYDWEDEWLEDNGLGGLIRFDGEYKLTRLRTYLRPEEMTEDIYFEPAPGIEPFSPFYFVDSVKPSTGINLPPPDRLFAALLFSLMALSFAFFGRKRNFAGRAAIVSLLLAALVL